MQQDNITVHYYVTHIVPCDGRHNYRGGDLRDKIGRRHSPVHRYSLGRDARVRRLSQGYGGPSRSLEKRRKHSKRHLDSQSDFSGSLKISNGEEYEVKDTKATSSDSKDILDEQLRHVQSEINMLEDHKTQLEIYLEERVQEADTLTSRIQELEMQLCKEKDECKRIISKTKKFVKAYNRHSRIQEELLRSQAQLQKLGDQLGSDAAKPGTNEDYASVSILSDGQTVPNHLMSPWTELHKIASPSKKRQRIQVADGDEQLKQATPAKGEGLMLETFRSEKLLRRDVHHAQLNNNKDANVKVNRNNGWRPMSNEGKIKRGKNPTTDIPSEDKLKVSESGLTLSSTSMAAHPVDEVVEVVEMDEKFEVVGSSSARVEKGVANEVCRLPFPLPPRPPVPQHAYSQYQGDGTENVDADVDVDGLEEETLYVDII